MIVLPSCWVIVPIRARGFDGNFTYMMLHHHQNLHNTAKCQTSNLWKHPVVKFDNKLKRFYHYWLRLRSCLTGSVHAQTTKKKLYLSAPTTTLLSHRRSYKRSSLLAVDLFLQSCNKAVKNILTLWQPAAMLSRCFHARELQYVCSLCSWYLTITYM